RLTGAGLRRPRPPVTLCLISDPPLVELRESLQPTAGRAFCLAPPPGKCQHKSVHYPVKRGGARDTTGGPVGGGVGWSEEGGALPAAGRARVTGQAEATILQAGWGTRQRRADTRSLPTEATAATAERPFRCGGTVAAPPTSCLRRGEPPPLARPAGRAARPR